MSRSTFLTITAFIALFIGFAALFFPAVLLESKGVVNNPAANVWMSEVGVLLLAIGVIVFLIRKEPDSLALKAILTGIIVIQSGLLLVEIAAYSKGIIIEISGIIPNSIIHTGLIIGLAYYLIRLNSKIKA